MAVPARIGRDFSATGVEDRGEHSLKFRWNMSAFRVNMLALRVKTEGGWALISRPDFSGFLFLRYVKAKAGWVLAYATDSGGILVFFDTSKGGTRTAS
uniref:Uncharacterized protein n=1 Tax=Candidatus Kentrum sp. LFY TaxID=2126342 RepID=A0A450UHV4_9GAMM|nr:MAG: hypothetical protein BECKLFY1418A_GA0070994_10212 [Candidatus Kentron sp. LFY]